MENKELLINHLELSKSFRYRSDLKKARHDLALVLLKKYLLVRGEENIYLIDNDKREISKYDSLRRLCNNEVHPSIVNDDDVREIYKYIPKLKNNLIDLYFDGNDNSLIDYMSKYDLASAVITGKLEVLHMRRHIRIT